MSSFSLPIRYINLSKMAGVAANLLSPEDWQRFKPLIQKLYLQQNEQLKKVRAFLVEHHNFLATQHMFKQRITEWSFDRKKVKAPEWRHILTVARQRGVKGRRFVEYQEAHSVEEEDELEFLSTEAEAKTVEYILCYAPPGSLSSSFPKSGQMSGGALYDS
jgi:Clr5 domain